jgi:hypothetical protein
MLGPLTLLTKPIFLKRYYLLGFPPGHKIELIQKGFFRRGQTNFPLHGKTKEKFRGYLSEFDVMALDRILPGFSSRGKG